MIELAASQAAYQCFSDCFQKNQSCFSFRCIYGYVVCRVRLQDRGFKQVRQRLLPEEFNIMHDWSHLMIKCLLWICMPNARVTAQTSQPANDRQVIDVANEDYAQKVKSALAEKMSQIPKLRYVACLQSKGIAVVLQTASASIGVEKYKLAIQEVCPISLGKASEQIRFFEEMMKCSSFSTDETDDSSLFSEEFKHWAAIFHVGAVWEFSAYCIVIGFASKSVKTVCSKAISMFGFN